jgi:hypothetical protein
LGFLTAAAVSGPFARASVFTGQLSTDGTPGIDATGALWRSGTNLAWTVDDNTPGLWHYRYQFSVRNAAGNFITFFGLETSSAFDANASQDLRNLAWFGSYQSGTFSPGAAMPYLPESLHGLGFTGDGNAYKSWVIDFYSPVAPAWGDFYAQGPADTLEGINSARDKGFKSPDTDPSIRLYPLRNGPVYANLIVPGVGGGGGGDGNQPVGRNGVIQVFAFEDVTGTGSLRSDPNFRLSNWAINLDGNSGNSPNVFSANASWLFTSLNGQFPWTITQVAQPNWAFSQALVYDANGLFVRTITDANIVVDISSLDMTVYIGNVLVPEPATLALVALGGAAMAWRFRRVSRRR